MALGHAAETRAVQEQLDIEAGRLAVPAALGRSRPQVVPAGGGLDPGPLEHARHLARLVGGPQTGLCPSLRNPSARKRSTRAPIPGAFDSRWPATFRMRILFSRSSTEVV